jgi:hypothetical protein
LLAADGARARNSRINTEAMHALPLSCRAARRCGEDSIALDEERGSSQDIDADCWPRGDAQLSRVQNAHIMGSSSTRSGSVLASRTRETETPPQGAINRSSRNASLSSGRVAGGAPLAVDSARTASPSSGRNEVAKTSCSTCYRSVAASLSMRGHNSRQRHHTAASPTHVETGDSAWSAESIVSDSVAT